MPYNVHIDAARARFPDYDFVRPLTPSEQKAAFHVRDGDGNEFCLKLISPNYARDRLDREIIALQSIQHPNVVRLREYVFSTKGGHLDQYIVEEFVAGEDLTNRLVFVSIVLHDSRRTNAKRYSSRRTRVFVTPGQV